MLLGVVVLIVVFCSVLSQYGAGTVTVRSRHCHSTVSALLQYGSGTVTVRSRHCYSTVPTLSQYGPGSRLSYCHIMILSVTTRSCQSRHGPVSHDTILSVTTLACQSRRFCRHQCIACYGYSSTPSSGSAKYRRHKLEMRLEYWTRTTCTCAEELSTLNRRQWLVNHCCSVHCHNIVTNTCIVSCGM